MRPPRKQGSQQCAAVVLRLLREFVRHRLGAELPEAGCACPVRVPAPPDRSGANPRSAESAAAAAVVAFLGAAIAHERCSPFRMFVVPRVRNRR